MIIIFSPTKTFTNEKVTSLSKPHFLNKANILIEQLKQFKIIDFKDKFKISDSLAKKTKDYYDNIHNNYAAVYQYGGTSFKFLDPHNINKNSLSNLYILSGLYGILNAFDGISPYRLEMLDTNLTNLYNFWQDDITNYLKNLNKPIINLASNEYSKVIQFEQLNIVTLDFKYIKNDKLIMNSMQLKKLRGLFANYILNNNLTCFEQIKNISIDGFKFNNNLSNENYYLFTKEE